VRRWLGLAAAAGLFVVGPAPFAARSDSDAYEAMVADDRKAAVSDAVVSLTLAGAATGAPRPATSAAMDQQDKAFVPHVLPVPAGSAVSFPNRDNIRHHVYSFSPAKRFELPLYIGTPAAPVVFDRPGVVVLGCNIHDWMVGYIVVLTTPHFARTGEDGRARLTDVPAGAYEARVWHPRMRGETEKSGQPITVTAGEAARLSFVVALKPDRRPAPPPAPAPTYDRPQS
jgi:plastocyanin